MNLMNKCLFLRYRSKKGVIYQVCTKKGIEGHKNENLCYMCELKEYKKQKPIKKVSKHKESVTERTYNHVFKRDGGKCRLCGTTKDLHLHHINGRGKDKTNNIDNCIMLCSHCHLEVVHKNNKYYRPYLNELIRGEKWINN